MIPCPKGLECVLKPICRCASLSLRVTPTVTPQKAPPKSLHLSYSYRMNLLDSNIHNILSVILRAYLIQQHNKYILSKTTGHNCTYVCMWTTEGQRGSDKAAGMHEIKHATAHKVRLGTVCCSTV